MAASSGQSVELTLQSKKRLNNGVEIPVLGLGVYQTPPGRITQDAVRFALRLGYRHIDTASIYANERDVGMAVRESGIAREEIFITTKVWNADQGYDSTIAACHRSLDLLGVGYVDLYLIHWPVASLRNETWEALIVLRDHGFCRSIGVSNYTIRHLEELLRESKVTPAVDQVEFNPFVNQKNLLDFTRSNGIELEAYSPLTRGIRLHSPVILSLAEKYSRTPAQVLIRWGLQHGLVEIPKSAHPSRIRENSDVFDYAISPEDMRKLDALDEGLHTNWDPADEP